MGFPAPRLARPSRQGVAGVLHLGQLLQLLHCARARKARHLGRQRLRLRLGVRLHGGRVRRRLLCVHCGRHGCCGVRTLGVGCGLRCGGGRLLLLRHLRGRLALHAGLPDRGALRHQQPLRRSGMRGGTLRDKGV